MKRTVDVDNDSDAEMHSEDAFCGGREEADSCDPLISDRYNFLCQYFAI